MIDVMFTTTADITNAVETELQEEHAADVGLERPIEPAEGSGWQFTPRALLQAKRDEIFDALSAREHTKLIAKSLATYWSPDHTVRAVCTISKRYSERGYPYWYAYHPRWQDFLRDGARSFVVFACMDKDAAYAVPAELMHENLNSLRTTDGKYWHVDLSDTKDGHLEMSLTKTKKMLPLAPYFLKLR